MDNIRNVIKILFLYTSPVEVLKGDTGFERVREESFGALARIYMRQYSSNEISNMLRYLDSEFEWHNNKIRGKVSEKVKRSVNVFDALLLFADNVLVEENGAPLCRYENLLRWRDMSVVLSEDMFTTAFLAQKDLIHPPVNRRFFWPPVIGHNNKELNRLLARGVAENHFHLKGSAPHFHLSWISMMNDVKNPAFKRALEDYENRRLHMKVTYRVQYAEPSLYILYLQAALIRLYFFARLQGEMITVGGVRQADYPGQSGDPGYRTSGEGLMRKEAARLLADPQLLQAYIGDIQKNIEYMKVAHAGNHLDYMLCRKDLIFNSDRNLNEVISGERWFLYQMFQKIYSGDQRFYRDLNWFYAYLLIKENIRSEMIQVNQNVGFHNFLDYQERKEMFIEGTPFQEVYLKMAVRDTIWNQHIKKLEARITPKDTPEKLAKAVREYDRAILKGVKEPERLREKYFFVCHFIKNADTALESEARSIQFQCRHYQKRLEVRKQAYALARFRERETELAGRIRGIDASSEEIGCRPEVFAQAFRFLKKQSVSRIDPVSGKYEKLPDLCITYHVGEDFLDITDGLRAIDEAVSFLNMRCGDRLGHALALGVDVDEWYASKSGYILLPQMDYLDNLVWLYSKIRKLRLTGLEDTLRYIEKKYDEYFRVIYLNNMTDRHLQDVMDLAIQEFGRKKLQHNYGTRQCVFSINTYYDSWKLRGDNPLYFKKGFFKVDTFEKTEWEESGINKIFPENYRIRYNPEAAYLYHTYHFNERVKGEGNKRKEIKVNPCIIKAVKAVQKRMQWMIAQKGIGIETNPSSNALIGTFKRYDKHPILNWYNNGLATSPEEIAGVPQIHVSINTDDQGVFATYIENEYAYLALALEKLKDENGNPRYSRTLIYQWLDNVREMGLVQSFEEIGENSDTTEAHARVKQPSHTGMS